MAQNEPFGGRRERADKTAPLRRLLGEWMRHRDEESEARRRVLAALYDAEARGLFRYALMILADHGEAQDAVQQAFAKCVGRSMALVRSQADYLRACVRNECFTILRHRRRDRVESAGTGPMVEPAAPGASDEERLVVEQALRALPAEQREVVHMKLYEGRTFDEIARRTGASPSTVASRYRYALAKLKESLAPALAGGSHAG